MERVETLGGGRLWLLKEVYLPSLAAWVLSSLKVAAGFAFTGAVVGEFVAASRGLGYLLSFAQSTYNAKLSLALIALIVLFVLLLFFLFDRLERHLLRGGPRAGREAEREALHASARLPGSSTRRPQRQVSPSMRIRVPSPLG